MLSGIEEQQKLPKCACGRRYCYWVIKTKYNDTIGFVNDDKESRYAPVNLMKRMSGHVFLEFETLIDAFECSYNKHHLVKRSNIMFKAIMQYILIHWNKREFGG